MSNRYLADVAQIINEKYLKLGNKLCIVLPNKRSGIFLKKEIIKLNDSPIWSPALLSIEEFIAKTANIIIPDQLELIFTLYKAHLQVISNNNINFDDFYKWGNSLISDIDEIDQYLVDPKELFSFLHKAKAIELWRPDNSELSDFEKNYLNFFNSLESYYNNYKQLIELKNMAWSGLATRNIAMDTDKYFSKSKWDFFIFIGFNALTPAQIKIIEYLISQEKAITLWDTDKYYMSDKIQEAGKFLRIYAKNNAFCIKHSENDYFNNLSHSFKIISAAGNVSQVKIANHIISNIISEKGADALNDTALIVPDEKLLMPILNSLPQISNNLNITMGLPIRQTNLFELFNIIFEMHLSESKNEYNILTIQTLLKHSILSSFISKGELFHIAQMILKSNKSYISFSELEKYSNSYIYKLLIKPISSIDDLLNKLTEIILYLKINYDKEKPFSEIFNETLFNLSIVVNRLKTAINANITLISYNLLTIKFLFDEIVKAVHINFKSEPLKGLQIMGALETRLLDFDNIIMLSVNEGIFPSEKTKSSLITFDIKREFGLPTHTDYNAIYAYHFYRLLQRSSNIWLIYNSNISNFASGEKSRFISQIETELVNYSNKIKVEHVDFDSIATISKTPKIKIKKTKEIIQIVKDYATSKGLSQSALSKYISCPLSFYFQYILKIDAKPDIQDSADTQIAGNIAHLALFNIFNKFADKSPLSLKINIDNLTIEKEVDNAFNAVLPNSIHSIGFNLLVKKIVYLWIVKFIDYQNEKYFKISNKVKILGLEKTFEKEISIIINSKIETIKVIGIIDRIDLIDKTIKIIDYKTGSYDGYKMTIENIDTLFDENADKFKKQFQLLFYNFLIDKNVFKNIDYNAIEHGIFYLRSIKNGLVELKFENSDKDLLSEQFEVKLKEIINSIFDLSIPFEREKPKEIVCSLCDYKSICNVIPN